MVHVGVADQRTEGIQQRRVGRRFDGDDPARRKFCHQHRPGRVGLADKLGFGSGERVQSAPAEWPDAIESLDFQEASAIAVDQP